MGLIEDDADEPDADDPLQPLLDDPVTTARQHFAGRRLCFPRCGWVLAFLGLQTIVLRAESAVVFPYLRTLIHCSRGEDAPGEWSGSVHCRSRAVVARLAQAESAFVLSAGTLVHCAALPLLGWVGDTWGRKPLFVLNFGGLLAECALNAHAGSIGAVFVATSIAMGTNGLGPALLATIADSTAADDRAAAYGLCLLVAAPCYAVTYAAAACTVARMPTQLGPAWQVRRRHVRRPRRAPPIVHRRLVRSMRPPYAGPPTPRATDPTPARQVDLGRPLARRAATGTTRA